MSVEPEHDESRPAPIPRRWELVLLAVIAGLLVVIAVLSYANDRRLSRIEEDQALILEASGDGSSLRAQDAIAKSLLRNGAIAMESMYTRQQTFANALDKLPAIEPTIAWQSDPAARADADEIGVRVAAPKNAYVLTTTSASGTTFILHRAESGTMTRTCGAGCTW